MVFFFELEVFESRDDVWFVLVFLEFSFRYGIEKVFEKFWSNYLGLI